MSSMFKKKGGVAFKPKLPSTRSRPAAIVAPAIQATKPVDIQSTSSSRVEVPDQLPTGADDVPARSTTELLSKPTQPSSDDVTDSSEQNDARGRPGSSAVDGLSEPRPSALDAQDTGIHAVDNNLISELAQLANVDEAQHDGAADGAGPVGADHEANTASVPQRLSPSGEEQESTVPNEVQPAQVARLEAIPVAETAVAAPKKRGRKRAAKAGTQDLTTEPDSLPKPTKRRKSAAKTDDTASRSRSRKRRTSSQGDADEQQKKRRARSLTPEDAESQVVDLQNLKMADLTQDLHIGKKFSRHDELRDRERQTRIKAKMDKAGEQSPAGNDGSESQASDRKNSGTGKASTESSQLAPTPAAGPQFRIVDGQIVVDQNSLVMDRHARAAAAQAGQDMETIEENDFTRLITSSSFLNSSKLKGPNLWSMEETELFYRGLSMFGTAFEIIAGMFPGKNPRHVKLKFNREERHCPQRIDAALIGEKTVKMDLEEYKSFTGVEFEPVDVIESEHRKIQEGYDAEQQRIVDEQAEIMRKKREELFADKGNEESAGKKKTAGKKKGKQTVAYGLNGEPVSTKS